MMLWQTILTLICCIGVCSAIVLKTRYNSACNTESIITKSEGNISSPYYPLRYPNNTSCTWTIIAPLNSILKIRLNDIDIEEDEPCNQRPCCSKNWLFLPHQIGNQTHHFCGNISIPLSFSVKKEVSRVKFHTSDGARGGRGFSLSYSILKRASCAPSKAHCVNGDCSEQNYVPCDADSLICYNNVTQRCDGKYDCPNKMDELGCNVCPEFKCVSDNKCFSIAEMCDKTHLCNDFTDELDCGYCSGKDEVLCDQYSMKCFNLSSERCDGKFHCPQGEDEIGCNCDVGEVLCNKHSNKCFHLATQRCDGTIDCPLGEDEIGCDMPCPYKFMCGEKECYSTKSCNTFRYCQENFDALNCKYLCDNGNLISHHELCDGVNNCGDNSDEQSCVKNSIITAAIMGSLICGLLLVIAVGCMCRLYSLRLPPVNYNIQQNEAIYPAGEFQSRVPPIEEFYHREPPPAYSVAVNDCQLQRISSHSSRRMCNASTNSNTNHQRRHARISRRHCSRTQLSVPAVTGHSNQVVSSPSPFHVNHLRLPNHSSPYRQVVSHSDTSIPSSLETSLAAAQDNLIFLGGGSAKTNNSNEISTIVESVQQCDVTSNTQSLRTSDVSPFRSSSTSASESPSRESVTSSTSLISELSAPDDDTQLLVL